MMYKRLGSIAALFIFLVFPASASTVSLLLVETGLNEGNSSTQYSSLWEGGLMAAFFDAGHIVTNSPIVQMKQKPEYDLSGLVETDFYEAAAGGADYYVLGYLEYRSQSGRTLPSGIVLKLYETESQKLVFEQNFPAGTGRSLNEEYRFAETAGRTIISHLKDR